MPVQRIHGNLVAKVSRMLQINDLLIMTAGLQPDRFGMSELGVQPERIARAHPEISMIIIHYPPNSVL